MKIEVGPNYALRVGPFYALSSKRGSIEAAIWENVTNNASSGKSKTWYSVQIYRRYQTDQGEYRQANSYALSDLVQVARVAELAEEWLNRRADSSVSSSAANDGGQQ